MKPDAPGRRRNGSDAERFEVLFREYFERVGAYLLARADRATAADALSRTFEIAWRRRADLPSEPLPWLIGVARRVLADERRSNRRRESLVERLRRTVGPPAPDHAARSEERNAILAALAELPPVQLEALLLVAWDGLSEREAGTALGCSRGAVALRIYRARRHLRRARDKQQPRATAREAPPNPSPAADTTGSSTEERA